MRLEILQVVVNCDEGDDMLKSTFLGFLIPGLLIEESASFSEWRCDGFNPRSHCFRYDFLPQVFQKSELWLLTMLVRVDI